MDILAIVTTVAVLVGICVILLVVCRPLRERLHVKKAREFDARGQHEAALVHILIAEKCWSYNLSRQSPDSYILDLDRLLAIVDAMRKQMESLQTGFDGDEITVAIKALQSFCSEASHYGLDKRSVRKEHVAELMRLMGQVDDARRRLRKACSHKAGT